MKQTKWLALLCSVFVPLLMFGCARVSRTMDTNAGESSASVPSGLLRMVERSELSTMDPAAASDAVSFNALNNVMEGLYRQGRNNEMVPGLVSGPPVVENEDKTYTFSIREEAQWENGDPVTAHDFVYAWRRAVALETGSPYRQLFSGIIKNAEQILAGEAEPEELGVYAESDKTLVIELERPYPQLERLLALPVFFPLNQSFVEEAEENFATDSETVLSNGPFTMTEWDERGIRWGYEKNSTYWEAEAVQLNKVVVDVIKGSQNALERYMNEEVDWMPATGDMVQEFNRLEEIRTYPTSSIVYLKFNLEREGSLTPLANEHIRKALALAVDKDELIVHLNNDAETAEGMVPAGIALSPENQQDFRKENGAFFTTDLESAREHFEKGMQELNRQTLSLELLGDDTESAVETLKYFQKAWGETFPSLEIAIQSIPFSKRIAQDTAGLYDIQLSGWSADFPNPINFLEIWESGSPHNTSQYANDEFDDLMQKARTAPDEETSWQFLLEAERVLMESGVVIPLYQPFTTVLSKPFVRGVVIHPTGPSLSLKWAKVER